MVDQIWLGLNIVYEILYPVLGWLLVLALAWLALIVGVMRCPRAQWKKMVPSTLMAGGLVAVVLFLLLPMLTASGLGELGYLVDWLFVAGVALLAGIAVMLVVWPLLAWMGRRPA